MAETTLQRERYLNCPLIEVVFQLNFPAILSIDNQDPVSFQESIREAFPNYQKSYEQENQFFINTASAQIIPQASQRQTRTIHSFVSKDLKWKIVLARNMMAFSTLAYIQWEDLLERFKNPLDSFIDIYRPAFFNRIGLRYVDAFDRESLGLKDKPWDTLLNPHITGCLAYKGDSIPSVNSSSVNAELVFDNVTVRVISGLGQINHNSRNPKETFVLNCDYFTTGEFLPTQLPDIQSALHNRSHLFFRSSIKEELRKALNPVEI